ncbi:hypothetical protein [Arenimonas sp. MALMAid1274]|uniref:hypothetical protein n=1 Tax=Arenimonas sp. MALMAid1274 TaxID=3411630 RepID=UPI003BA38135
MDLLNDPTDLATRWQTQLGPLAGRAWPIRCSLVFSPQEVVALRLGLWPQDMDDRWAIWLDPQGVLRCWRSWTSQCLYEAPLVLGADGGAACPVVHVLDDPEHYQRSPVDGSELDRFEGVLALVLRGARGAATPAIASVRSSEL